MKLGVEVGLGPGHIVLDGDQAPPPLRGTSPTQFSAHICCGQMAAWIKMSLGMEQGLSPDDFVLDRDPALPSQKGGRAPSPIFGPFLLWPKGCMHQHANWYGGRPRPRRLCVRWRPSSSSPKGAKPPIFGPYPLRSNGCIDGIERAVLQTVAQKLCHSKNYMKC